jgi:hypothetical protein
VPTLQYDIQDDNDANAVLSLLCKADWAMRANSGDLDVPNYLTALASCELRYVREAIRRAQEMRRSARRAQRRK